MRVALGIAWLLLAVYGFVEQFGPWRYGPDRRVRTGPQDRRAGPPRDSDGERAASRSRKRGHARLRRDGGPSEQGPGMAARTPAPPYPLEIGEWDA